MGTITSQLLAEIPLFSNMDSNEIGELRSIMTERIYQPGQVCMKAGDQNTTLQIIEQGEVEIWLDDTEGKKVILDNIGPGKFFGELSMLSGDMTRSATVTSEEQVVTLELNREDFFGFLRRRPDAAIDVLTELGERLKHTDDILRTRVSRNPNDAHEQTLSVGQRIADVIADFSGSMPFLFINLTIFVIWIVTNVVDSQIFHDPYPFQFLTMAVSLEAIFLSIFVLISQNRQAAKDRIKADLDYQVDVKSEMEMSILAVKIHDIEKKLHHIHSDLLEEKGALENGHEIK